MPVVCDEVIFVSDIAIFVLRRDVKLQLTNWWSYLFSSSVLSNKTRNSCCLHKNIKVRDVKSSRSEWLQAQNFGLSIVRLAATFCSWPRGFGLSLGLEYLASFNNSHQNSVYLSSWSEFWCKLQLLWVVKYLDFFFCSNYPESFSFWRALPSWDNSGKLWMCMWTNLQYLVFVTSSLIICFKQFLSFVFLPFRYNLESWREYSYLDEEEKEKGEK